MSTLQTHQPANKNFLQTDKWVFTMTKMPNLVYFVQSATIPAVSIGEAMVPTPYSETYKAGDKMVFEPLSLTFLVDEDLRTWEEIFNWMKGLTFPNNAQEYRTQQKSGLYSDATLELVTNNYTRNFRIKFIRCFPTFLSDISLTYTENADITPTCSVTFRYDTFSIER